MIIYLSVLTSLPAFLKPGHEARTAVSAGTQHRAAYQDQSGNDDDDDPGDHFGSDWSMAQNACPGPHTVQVIVGNFTVQTGVPLLPAGWAAVPVYGPPGAYSPPQPPRSAC
jgi:hypothetical protein